MSLLELLKHLSTDSSLSALENLVDNDLQISNLVDDSRLVKMDGIFVSDRKVTNNKLEYIFQAIENGASFIITNYSLSEIEEFKSMLDDRSKKLEIESFLNSENKLACVENPSLALSFWARDKYSQQPKHVVGITGTNGKTSIAWFFQSIWKLLGAKSASVGTLGVSLGNEITSTGYTCPPAIELHKILQNLSEQKITHTALEVSSHALAENRADGVKFSACAFTNLSEDHGDYHGDMGNYFYAKMRLFSELLDSKNGVAVLNINSSQSSDIAVICRARGINIIAYGLVYDNNLSGQNFEQSATVTAKILARSLQGMKVEFALTDENILTDNSAIEPADEGVIENIAKSCKMQDKCKISARLKGDADCKSKIINLSLLGDFQAENLAGAIALFLACGGNWKEVLKILPQINSVAGRMELLTSGSIKKTLNNSTTQKTVVVDYAHTPDALERVLLSLKFKNNLPSKVKPARIITVFGCGGNRDQKKRASMGKIATKLSDYVIVTGDNPRYENAGEIRQQILAGCELSLGENSEENKTQIKIKIKPKPEDKFINDTSIKQVTIVEQADREKAIALAIAEANPEDVVLIAGKGHETGQLVNGEIIPFDDREVVRKILENI